LQTASTGYATSIAILYCGRLNACQALLTLPETRGQNRQPILQLLGSASGMPVPIDLLEWPRPSGPGTHFLAQTPTFLMRPFGAVTP